MLLDTSGNFWQVYPQASIGILAMEGVDNPSHHAALDEYVRQVEADLRSRWAGATRGDLNRLPEFAAYRSYYKRFDKTYPVQGQFESVVLKGKPLRGNGSLVLAMFAAELRNRLLTAGHDLATIEGDLVVNVAQGHGGEAEGEGERYMGLGGRDLTLQTGDMHMRDRAGIISSVLYGPDDRTQISANTHQVIFCVYAPAGIEPIAVEKHLADIVSNVRLVVPHASVIQQQVYKSTQQAGLL